MATNEILQFAETDTGTNLLTQAEYLADAQRPIGNQPGVARSKLVNKALRQASLIAAGLAEYIADNQANNITDALTPQNIADYLQAAITGALGVTPPQFDNDTSLATTAFVQRAIGNARGYTSLAETTNMDESHAGKVIHFGDDEITLNLPPTASVANGTVVTLWNGNSNNSFIGKQGSDTIVIANSTYSSIPSGLNETYSFIKVGAQWILIGGSGLNKYVRSFQSVMTTSGYQRLPSGVIIQTGRGTFNKAVSASLPIVFPTAFVGFAAVHVGGDNTANPSLNGYTTSTITLNWAYAAETVDAVWIAIGY